jgi:hypothetical protein
MVGSPNNADGCFGQIDLTKTLVENTTLLATAG